MVTHYSEDHPDRKAEETVDATPVEGLDREPAAVEPAAVEAKVVKAPAKTPPKKSTTAQTKKV